MALQSLGVLEVDSVGLVCILCHICKLQTESLAKTAELDLTLVLQTESERLLGNLLKIRV